VDPISISADRNICQEQPPAESLMVWETLSLIVDWLADQREICTLY